MRRLLALLLALPALVLAEADRAVVEDGSTGTCTVSDCWGQGTTTLVAHTCASNACDRATPSGATEGMTLASLVSYALEVKLSTGTFSGTGTFELWVFSIHQNAWLPLVDSSGAVVVKTPPSGQSKAVYQIELAGFRPTEWRLAVKSVAVGTSAAAPTLSVGLYGCLSSGCGR